MPKVTFRIWRGDRENGNFGLIAWGISTHAWWKASYGDDNARQMLGALAVFAALAHAAQDIPEPLRAPVPGPQTDAPYAPTAILPGGIVMPLYQKHGSDGFFLAREFGGLWLRLSAALRRLRIDRIAQWLDEVSLLRKARRGSVRPALDETTVRGNAYTTTPLLAHDNGRLKTEDHDLLL